jgi:Tfp pilus assembly protein PilO
MKTLMWHGRRWTGKLGASGCAALAVLAAGAVLYWGVTVPGQARLAAAQAEHARTQARITRAEREAAARGSTAVRIDALLARFPRGGNLAVNDTLTLIQEQAGAHQLVFDAATYQLSTDGANGIERYAVSLPLKGRYPDVRAFLDAVRARAPHVALDSVTFMRATRAEAAVEAQLQFTAYFRTRP